MSQFASLLKLSARSWMLRKVIVEQTGKQQKAGNTSIAEVQTEVHDNADTQSIGTLMFCVLGLQASYLIWGYVQEKVMTKDYRTGRFPSASFCVFSNRILAVVVASAVTLWRHKTLRMPAPLSCFAPCSITNSFSSFAQYQALRYVSFPLQTLAKSAKVIPVMLMGKVLNKKAYSLQEYLEALLVSICMLVFSFSESSGHVGRDTHVQGALMLFLYLAGDSFTSQWQSRVYKEFPSVDQFQMMFVVNMWSFLLTLVALVACNELLPTIAFLAANPDAIRDNVTIAVTSATGQVFIFYTIKKFGPIVFTLTMTARQMISILISAVFFSHPMGPVAYCSAAMIFAMAVSKVYLRDRQRLDSASPQMVRIASILHITEWAMEA